MRIFNFCKTNYGLILVLVLSFWAVRPLFAPGFFPMHDNEQVGRLYDLDQSLKMGHFPPRLVPNLGFGYGYPLFNFYPPFAYYIAEIFVLLGFTYILSTKIMIILGFLGAALAMYLLVRELFGRVSGVVAAVSYTYLPYHAVNVYVRGALPEFWALVFLPLIFWSIFKLYKKLQNIYVILIGFFVAALILTHNLVALMTLPFVGLFSLFLLVKSAKRKVFLLKILFGVILGFLISIYFWLPSYVEKKFIMIDLLTSDLAHYSQHFLYIRQFWNSPWGYGGSIYGLLDGLSFQVGKVQIILSALAFLYAFYLWFIKKIRNSNIFVLFSFFLLSLFMSTFYSKFVWDLLPPLWYIQFPWRFLLIAGFFASILCGYFFQSGFFKNNMTRFLLAAAVIAAIIILNKNYFVPNKYLENAEDKDYINKETLRYETSSLAAEYTPKGIATRKTDINTTVIDIGKDSIKKQGYSIVSGDMKVNVISDLVNIKKFAINSKVSGEMLINTYAFPGWEVYLDNEQVNYSDKNRLKLISIEIPEGQHIVIAKFKDTFIRRVSNIVSVISVVGIILLLLSRRKYLLV